MSKFRNNNPGNMRYNPAFKGVTGKDSRGFAIFKTEYHGIRAMRILLQNYIKKGFNTIEKIINRYAPASDSNQPLIYINYVSSISGIPRDQILKADQVEKIMVPMVKMETGKDLTSWELSMARNLTSLSSWIPWLSGLGIFFLINKIKGK